MNRKIFFFCILLMVDLIFIHAILRSILKINDFAVVVWFAYAILLNFLLAWILSRTKLGQFSGLFVINAIAMPLLMYLYT